MVERHNRTLEGMLSIWTNSHQDDWDQHLPLLSMAYRSAPHETTSETPNMLNLGREVTLPVDLLLEAPPDEERDGNLSRYAARLQDRLRTAHEAARASSTSQMISQKRHYDQNVRLVTYKEGDIVLLHNPAKKKGKSFKLTRPWTGPFLIITKISDVTFRIQASPRGKAKVVHADRLKPCVGRRPTDLGFSETRDQGGGASTPVYKAVPAQTPAADDCHSQTPDSEPGFLEKETTEPVEDSETAPSPKPAPPPGGSPGKITQSTSNPGLPCTRYGRRVRRPRHLAEYLCDHK